MGMLWYCIGFACRCTQPIGFCIRQNSRKKTFRTSARDCLVNQQTIRLGRAAETHHTLPRAYTSILNGAWQKSLLRCCWRSRRIWACFGAFARSRGRGGGGGAGGAGGLNIGNFNSDCGHSTTRQRRLDFDDSTDLIDFDDSTDSAIRLNIGNFNSDCGHWTARMRRHDLGDPTDLTDFDDTTLTT